MKRKESFDVVFYKYSVLTLLMLLSAINYNLFINPVKLVAGGTNGISILIQEVFGFAPSIIIFVVSLIILILALVFNEKAIFKSALYASLIYPLFVSMTEPVISAITIDYSDLFVITVFSALISGIISGIVCKLDLSQGGIILISQVLYKKLKISISTSNFLINLVIVGLGGYILGISNVMYAIIYLYIYKTITNRIIVGISQKKMFYIITSDEKEVTEYIIKVLKSSYTLLSAKGGYKYKKKSVIMTTIPTSEYFKLKEGIHEIDKNAFFIVTDSYQVLGGK